VTVPCQDRSRQRRWPKASRYKGLSPGHARSPKGDDREYLWPASLVGGKMTTPVNCRGVKALREMGKFKPLIFGETHAAGDTTRVRLMCLSRRTWGLILLEIRRFIMTRFVFSLGTRDNISDLVRFAPEFADLPLQRLAPGMCYVQSTASQRNLFARPRLVQVRPRVTQHGGTSRIFSRAGQAE
jgi:hypothetical protein